LLITRQTPSVSRTPTQPLPRAVPDVDVLERDHCEVAVPPLLQEAMIWGRAGKWPPVVDVHPPAP